MSQHVKRRPPLWVRAYEKIDRLVRYVALPSFAFAIWSKSPIATDWFKCHPVITDCLSIGLISLFIILIALHFYVELWNAKSELEERHAELQENYSEETNRLKSQMTWKEMTKAGVAVSRCRTLWERPNDNDISDDNCEIYEDDPVYQQVRLDRHLAKIFSQPIVQRLNHIKQLSFAYLAFPSATHTRLAHSLGACRNAELVMRRIFQVGSRLYSESGEEKIDLSEEKKAEYIKLAMITALVHDLGHAPLSHALEIHLDFGKAGNDRVRPDKNLSQKYVSDYLRPTIEAAGVNPADVIALIKKDIDHFRPNPWMHFISDLIDSPLDVDRMDYLARDSHMTGLSIGALNMEAFMERIVPFKEIEKDGTVKIELAFDKSVVPYVEQFLYARDVMYLSCYEHPKKLVAEGMLGYAFDDFLRSSESSQPFNPSDLALLTDQQMIELMLTYSGPSTLTSRFLERLMRGITFDWLEDIPIKVNLADEPAARSGKAFQDLPAEIQSWALRTMSVDYQGAYLRTPTEWARNLGASAGVDGTKIIVTVPSWSLVDKWQKEGQIRILLRQGQGYSVDYVSKVSKIINDFTRVLATVRLKLRIFVDPDLTPSERQKVLAAARDLFSKRE